MRTLQLHPTQALALLAASLLLLPPAWAATKAKPAATDSATSGKPVTVTPEMTGAGIVSSGTVLPHIPPVTGNRSKPVASWGKPLPYPIMIADRRNNRLIEVTPDKRIVWEFPSPHLKLYRGNEDVNFSRWQTAPSARKTTTTCTSSTTSASGPMASPMRAATRACC
jgi:hypothetical protein